MEFQSLLGNMAAFCIALWVGGSLGQWWLRTKGLLPAILLTATFFDMTSLMLSFPMSLVGALLSFYR
jgi:hypothetical protein